MSEESYEEIIYAVEDPVATITLNRPKQLNAWTDRMGAEVRHAFARAEADPAVVAIVLVTTSLDAPRVASPARRAALLSGLASPALRPLYVGVFTLHGILAASFVAVPIALRAGLGLAPESHYTVYLPVLLGSFVVVGPMIARSAPVTLSR